MDSLLPSSELRHIIIDEGTAADVIGCWAHGPSGTEMVATLTQEATSLL
jgi:hypothetical protein